MQNLKPFSSSSPHMQVAWGPAAAALGVAVLLLVAAIATALFTFVVQITDRPVEDLPVWLVLLSTVVLQIGMLAIAFVFGPLRQGPPSQLLGSRQLPTPSLFGWTLLAFIGTLTISATYVVIASQISDDWIPEPVPGGIDLAEARLLAFAVIVLIAPFAEEVFFRGFLFAAFAKRYGFWIAALLSAAVFALVHWELARTIPAMLSGIVFAAVYWRSGSVWPAVLAHTGQNAIAFGVAV